MEVASKSGALGLAWAGKMVTLKGLPARGLSVWGQKRRSVYTGALGTGRIP